MAKSKPYDPYKKYKGFGAEHTAAEWSKALNIKLSLVKELLTDSPGSVERLADFFKTTYDPTVLERKPREGAHMAETRQLVEGLLTRSGYEVRPGSVVVKLAYNTTHAVFFEGLRIGSYNYKTGWLGNLYKAEAVPLKAPYSGELKIQKGPNGYWNLTAESRALRNRHELKINEEPTEEKYAEILRKHEKTPAEPKGTLYEYKGREATCAEWSRRLGIPKPTLWRYLNQGLTIEEALERFDGVEV